MTLLTWNCNGALRKKFRALEQFGADIVVIQECEDPSLSADKPYKEWASNFLWRGEIPSKGLGIFAKPGISLSPLNWDDDGAKFFLPAEINGSFTLLGVWAHQGSTRSYQYIGQFWKYLEKNRAFLKRSVILGDFNSNTIWDKPRRLWNHSHVVKELLEMGIRSVYHEITGEVQGAESTPTFYLQKNPSKPYHIDYLFACSNQFPVVNDFFVGNPNEWLGISDHVPMIATL